MTPDVPRSLDDVDLYARVARTASRHLAFAIVGALVCGVLVVVGYRGPFGWIAVGLFSLIPIAAMRVADPTRWSSLGHLAETAAERRDVLLSLRERLADPATPTIATKFGALYLLSDFVVFVDSADVEVMRTSEVVGVSAVDDTRSHERRIRIELSNAALVDVPMETKDVAKGIRRLEEHLGHRGRIAPAAA